MAAAIQDGSVPLLTRGRVDRVHVQVGYRERPDGSPATHFLLDLPVAEDGRAPDQEQLLTLLEPVVYAGSDAPRHHSLHVHRWHNSWGAAAGALDIGLMVTTRASVAPGSAAYDVVVGAFRDLLELADPPHPVTLTRSAAVAAARRSVAAACDRDAADLTLASEEHQVARGTWSLGLRSPDRHRFVVSVGIVDAYVGSVHVRHEPAAEVHDSLGTE